MTFLTYQLGNRNSCLRQFTSIMRLVYPLMALNIDWHHFQKDGDDMFIPKEMLFSIMKDWCVSFSYALHLLWTLCKRIFTESDIIRQPKICQEILFCATQLIQKAIQIDDVIMNELTEIVLNVDDEEQWYYYFVDHRNRLLFWVDSVDLDQNIGTDLQGVTAYSHISTF